MDPVAVEVFWKLHEGLPKQGPGSDASTRRALEMVRALPPAPEILDLGCGPGRQSLVLARETGGRVTAVDRCAPFLDQLSSRAKSEGLEALITTVERSMEELPYAEASFDLIWSEGAIYSIGFERGLRLWRRLLRPAGFIAVTECTWLVQDPPRPVRAFWERHYPAMQSLESNARAIERAGFGLVGSFVLDEAEWWDDYYTPLGARIDLLRGERDDAAWVRALDAAKAEEMIVRNGLGSFGYVFYVMKRTGA